MNPRNRDLLWQLTVRAVEMRHRGSYLGFMWAVLTPLIMLALYMTVFTLIFKTHFRNEPPIISATAIFIGLIIYQVVAETMATSPLFISTQPNLVKKVVFPLELIPVSQIGATWFHFAISVVLFLIGIVALGSRGPGLTLTGLLWFPVIIAPVALLSLGIGWLISALGVFFRDIGQIMNPLTQIALWASAVFYTPKAAQQIHTAWMILKWNPLLHAVSLARDALIWHDPIDLKWLGYTWAFGILSLLFGRWFFRKTQAAFADVI